MSFNRFNFISSEELAPALEGNIQARINCISKMFGLEKMTETENITSVTEASSGENLKIEPVSLSGDFSEVCKNLEKNINSAVEADLKKAVEEHGKLENFERYLGSTCLVLLGLYNTEHKNVEDVLKKLVDMALTDMDKLSRKKLIALTTLAVFLQ